MKKSRILLYATAASVLFATGVEAAVPVIDVSAIVQWGRELAQQAQQYALQAKQYVGEQFAWATQAKQYALQAEQAVTEATQLAAFVHNPSLGEAGVLLNQAGLGSDLPMTATSALSLVNGVHYGGGGMPQIQGILNTLGSYSTVAYSSNHVYSPTDGTWSSQQLIANANSIAGTQGAAAASYADMQAHQAAFQALQARLAVATTPKDVQDLQAQIALQQTWFASQQGQVQAIALTYQAQQDSMRQQASEQVTKSLDDQIAQARTAGIIQ